MRFVVLALALAACTVDRKSEQFACGEGGRCPDGRRCVDGYCISGATDGGLPSDGSSDDCPSPCDSCDLEAQTCEVLCATSNECGTIVCPTGFTCTINCISNSACDSVSCDAAAACTINCSGNRACGPISCGNGPCDVTCTSTNSCDVISCTESCRCDVACAPGACGLNACPNIGQPCTVDGDPGSSCSSTPDGCNTCL